MPHLRVFTPGDDCRRKSLPASGLQRVRGAGQPCRNLRMGMPHLRAFTPGDVCRRKSQPRLRSAEGPRSGPTILNRG